MRYLAFLLVIFFICPPVFAQEVITDKSLYQAIYDFDFQRDSTDVNTKRNEKMILFIGDQYSLFESYYNRYNDSIGETLQKKYPNRADLQLFTDEYSAKTKTINFNFRILKNKEQTLVFDSFWTDRFIYEEKEALNWKITTSRDTINGYPATLATTHFGGRDYKAWFTEELPFSDGPYKFKGLPGLIVKVGDTQNQYVFDLISFNKKEEGFSFDPKAGAKTTKQKFFKARNTFKKNFIGGMDSRGVQFEGDMRENQKRMQKLNNNKIEIPE